MSLNWTELKEAPVTIVGGLDLHRAQITFDYVDTATGEVRTGRITPACRESFARFLADLPTCDVDMVVEGCTGWLFVADELARAGMRAHVADPAEAAALRGRKKRAKTDRADARHLRQLMIDDRVPESWIPPAHVLEARTLGRLYMDLLHSRNAWAQRTHATLFHYGAPPVGSDLTTAARQDQVLELAGQLPASPAHAVDVAVHLIRGHNELLAGVRQQLAWIGRHQNGAKAIQSLYGVGELVGPLVWAEMGDARRFGSSRQAVRHTGLDITVHDSDGKRSSGHLARQGPGVLRWALYEAAMKASHRTAPDYAYYHQVKARHSHKVATISVARKIARPGRGAGKP